MQPEALRDRMVEAVSVQPFTPDLRGLTVAARRRRRARAAQVTSLGLVSCAMLTGTLIFLDQPTPAPAVGREPRVQPGPTRVLEGGISYRLAEPDAVPVLSRDEALAAYRRASSLPFTSMELIRFTNDVTGKIRSDGSVVLEYQDTLAWAFIEVGTTPAFYGGIDSPRPTNWPTDCDRINVIRADRRAVPWGPGFGFSDCAP